jgi:UDP-N-acetylmuramoyl-L-alanyl-D-glutamate--2,6-diaminopimelate ligase
MLPQPPTWCRDLLTVGVTGTNGKTSTTRWTAACLAPLARPVPQVTTLGAFLDDDAFEATTDYAGFLATMRAGHDRGGRFAALELTSEALSQGFARAWPCTIGVFTNLTHDHLDRHGSAEHYLASKAQLFLSLPPGGTAVLNGCDPASELIAEVIPSGVRVLRYGVRSRGEPTRALDVEATSVAVSWSGTRVALAASPALDFACPPEMHTRGIGSIYAENALAAFLAAVAAGVAPDDAAAALALARPVPGRFEVVAERPFVVVDYAHSPDALQRTVATARALCRGRLTVVFGAGGDRDRAKREPMGQAARAADHLIVTSDNPRSEDPAAIASTILRGLHGHPSVVVELDRTSAISSAVSAARAEDVVLIAGKGHEHHQTIGGTARPFSDAEVARLALER